MFSVYTFGCVSDKHLLIIQSYKKIEVGLILLINKKRETAHARSQVFSFLRKPICLVTCILLTGAHMHVL